MKSGKRELFRAQALIENDRMCTGDNFIELLRSDLDKLLKDYFDFVDLPKVKIEKNGDCYAVIVSIISTRIKAFEYIEKD